NLYDFTCPEAITEISIVLKKAFVCEIDATICTEELMVVQEELWALDRKEKSCEQAIQGIATALDFALISYPELKEIPKTLSFGRLLDSETLKEFPGLTVNPVTDFDLELEHIDPFRRLFLVVSKENEKMNCDLLATAITTDFGSEEDSPLRIDSLSEEEIAVLTGTGSLESLSTKEDFISAFRAFAGTTGLDGKIPISNPGFLILSGTGEDFIVSDAIEKNRFEGSRIFLSVPGYEFRKGDALRMRFVPDKTKDWKGEKLVFTACQFEEYFTDSNTPRMFHWIDPVFSDQTVIQFGIPEGELLVDYLLHLNKRFVQQLFSVETISNQNAIKIEVTENGVPIKALPAKNDTESFNPSICLKGIAGHPTLNKLTEKLQVIAENAKQKYLVGTVQTAGAIAGLCVNPLPTAVELLKGANTRFKIVGFKKAVAGEKETPITLGKTELPAKPPATLPLAKEELSLEQVKQKAVSRSCVNLRSDVVKSDGGIDYLKLASLRQSVVFLPDLEIASITVVDDKHSPGNTLYHFVAFEGPCVYSWDIATQNDVAGNLLTEGAVVDFYGKVHVLSALDFPSLVETRFSFKPLFVVKNS
ncbi:hypothetical protein KKE06_05660, partial [Candidatus Micrarchaeota archaeon]|nr:hypothetical protein [Candidatus Micrarchaeota archaeon]